MRAHVIENKTVVNTIEVDTLDAMPNLIAADIGGIGWHWDGVTLTDPNALTQAEIIAHLWSVVRAERNSRLIDCDWTQLVDAPVDSATWTAYRQELRDITNQTDPANIIWPAKP